MVVVCRGGVWGFLFLLPLRKYIKSWWARALIFGGCSMLMFVPCTRHPLAADLLSIEERTQRLSIAEANLQWFPGLFPSAVQLFIVFPNGTPFGVGGIGLGNLTPAFVLIFNTLGWSIPAYAWFRLAGDRFVWQFPCMCLWLASAR